MERKSSEKVFDSCFGGRPAAVQFAPDRTYAEGSSRKRKGGKKKGDIGQINQEKAAGTG